MKAIAIYDDKCRVCTAFGSFGKGVVPLGHSTRQARELMTAQFGKSYGFSIMLFTPDKVSWGSEATAEITRKGYSAFVGKTLRKAIHLTYPLIVSLLTVILRRKKKPGAPSFKGRKLPPKGTMPLTPEARKIAERHLKRGAKAERARRKKQR